MQDEQAAQLRSCVVPWHSIPVVHVCIKERSYHLCPTSSNEATIPLFQ
ncbi:predicted protein [Plenodomus lingam JN3]|uniref:Predicted protein n=1 Tax=Leptosphaeria maculans (strain JN3 / isolate v23.1.3 / race Av1-4-5-6-7-8) TaxID=985895 RepID=E5AE07_LEPMJ|nr:predicted protein [Plenodomus lingam JN3]CBY01446.1 predicted protein [Plenodomus lingam JN3]